ncbi:hypothetical protein J5N97_017209 [Dioscorea zingiberensis]|uniref:Uncharacterized protein n=1 Tax=Dioscorea zingiberensis TaxID=325984 RepID=A0A9D5HG55_9LILI|nr:hypothetical protein J5N97_017209 [Dioscorea zingiberensis]
MLLSDEQLGRRGIALCFRVQIPSETETKQLKPRSVCGLLQSNQSTSWWVCLTAEQAPNDLGLSTVVVHGGHEVGETVAKIVDLPVQALNVVTRLL